MSSNIGAAPSNAFCSTCKWFVPKGVSKAGTCRVNPVPYQIGMATTHWCGNHELGPQRNATETYINPASVTAALNKATGPDTPSAPVTPSKSVSKK